MRTATITITIMTAAAAIMKADAVTTAVAAGTI
jgi:hypothetical protein